jgi:hypothetical protein
LIYSKHCYFARFIITETITCKTFTKLYTGVSYKPSSDSLEDIKKELENIFPIKNHPSHMTLKDIVIDTLKKKAYKLLNKSEPNLNLFESIDTLIQG